MAHWLKTAERLIDTGRAAPPSADAARATLRAMLARRGVAAMVDDAAAAHGLAAQDDPWRPLACMVQGAGLYLLGDTARAVPVLEEGARRGGVIAPGAQVLCLAELALIRAGAEDWDEATLLVSRARSQLGHAGIARYPIAALVHAASALVRAHRDSLEAAQDDRRKAVELLERLVDPPPWYGIEVRVALARTLLRLGDAVAARALTADAELTLRHLHDAPLAATWVAECRAQADTFAASVLVGPASLTNAELRVLRLLPTHLSFREMGLYLHVTANTVKTHAHAVYRKLDACSRSEAVVHARGLGLLSASPESNP
jgi:LuxR family transcriptional regulator, maltose regulon positive regulatory protein